MSPWVKTVIPSFVVALALSLLARIFLKGQFSEPMVEGISFWLLFLALYPANIYFSRKKRENTKARYPFLKYVQGATAGAVMVLVLVLVLNQLL